MSEYHVKLLKFQNDLKQYKTAQAQLDKQPNSRTLPLHLTSLHFTRTPTLTRSRTFTLLLTSSLCPS